MTVLLSPVGGAAAQFFDNNGTPLTGGKLYSYVAGTTTPQATYTSASGATAHTNPVILDSGGRVPGGEIWLTDGLQYKFVLRTSADVLIGTYDNLAGVNSNFVNFLTETEVQTATAGQTVFTLATMQYQPGTNNLSVFVDGVNQIDGSTYSYVETSSTVVTFTAGLHVGALVKFTTAQTLSTGVTDASLVTYQPPFAGGVDTTVELKLAQTVSVLDFIPTSFHASIKDGTNTTPLQTYIQSALNSTTLSGSPGYATTIYFPTGYYRITATLDIPALCEFYGDGQFTVIQPIACTAFNFLASTVIGPRRIAGFWIYGSGNDNQTAITCNLDSVGTGRVTGVLLENIYIAFYGMGIYGRGFWNSTFRKVVMNNVWAAVKLEGRNIKTLITDCSFTKGTATGVNNAIGVFLDAASAVRPEDTWIVNSIIYGFDNAVNWASALNGGITGCDLDVCQKEAIIGTITDGGFVIENNWIAVSNAAYAVYGIKLNAVGTLQTSAVRKISGNNILSYTTTPASSVGIYAGSNTNNINIVGNVITSFETGIHMQLTYGFNVKDNTTSGTSSRGLYLESAQGGTVADNVFDAAVSANVGNMNVTFGKNLGASTTSLVGAIPFGAGATTATATFASLGFSNIPTNVIAYVNCMAAGTANQGPVWGDVTATTITLYRGTAVGSIVGMPFEIICSL